MYYDSLFNDQIPYFCTNQYLFLMKKLILIMAVIPTMPSFGQNKNPLKYPETQKGETVDVYFGTKVNDPYRWLEDDRSAETAALGKTTKKGNFGYLEQIPFRDELKNRLEKLWNYEKISAPFIEGDFTYYFKNDGLQNQSVLYRKDKAGKETVFLDPNTFSKDGTTSLVGVDFSKDGSKVAYAISEGGSDWRKVILMDALSNKVLEDIIIDVKFSGLYWSGNEGFFFSSYDKPKGSEL